MHIAPFIPHYIILFVIEFTRNSQFLPYSSPPPCKHTSHRICANLRIESRAGWGEQLPPFASRVDADVCKICYFKLWLKILVDFNFKLFCGCKVLLTVYNVL